MCHVNEDGNERLDGSDGKIFDRFEDALAFIIDNDLAKVNDD